MTAIAGRIEPYKPSLIRLRVGSALVEVEVWTVREARTAAGWPGEFFDAGNGLTWRFTPAGALAPHPASLG